MQTVISFSVSLVVLNDVFALTLQKNTWENSCGNKAKICKIRKVFPYKCFGVYCNIALIHTQQVCKSGGYIMGYKSSQLVILNFCAQTIPRIPCGHHIII